MELCPAEMGTKIYRLKRSRIIWALPPLMFFCGAAATAGSTWQDMLAQADRFAREGKNTEAVAAAQSALADAEKSLGPENPEVSHVLARLTELYRAAGDVVRFPEMEKRVSGIKSKSFEDWLTLGILRHSEEKLPESEDALKKALAFKPDDPEAERELAIVQQDMGRDEEAVNLFEKATKQNLRDRDLYMRLLRSDMRLGRYAEAKQALAQAKKIGEKTAGDCIDEGIILLELNETVQAREAFENAITVDTANPAGWHHMGMYLSRSQQYPEAEKYFKQALEKQKANPNTRSEDVFNTIDALGIAVQMQGHHAEAEALYRKCSENMTLKASRMSCLRSLGMVYDSWGKNAEAEDAFKRAIAMCEKESPCSCRGRLLIDLGNFHFHYGRSLEAATEGDQVGKSCEGHQLENPDVLLDLAEFYMRMGDSSKGEAYYGKILAMPQSGQLAGSKVDVLPFAQEGMAKAEMTQGRFHEAEDLYRRAILIWENRRDGQQRAGALDGLAEAYEGEGKLQEAAAAKEKAAALRSGDNWRERLDRAERLAKDNKSAELAREMQGILTDMDESLKPGSPEIGRILARLSRLYEAAADPERIPEIERRLSAVKPKDFEVWLALGALMHFEQKPLEAKNALKNALALRPEDAEAGFELALVCDETGDFEEAVRLLTGILRKKPTEYPLWSQLARTYAHLGRFAEAKEAFAQARQFGGETAAAYIREGYFNLEAGGSDQAKEAFENAIAIDTASPQGYHHMGSYFAYHQQFPEAVKNYRRALEIMEADPKAQINPLVDTIGALGNALLAQGRDIEAEAVLRKCLEKAPPTEGSTICLESLGRIYASQGKNAQAEDVFKRAAAVCEVGDACTCRGGGLLGLGDFYLNQGQGGKASAIADKIGKSCTANRSIYVNVLLRLATLHTRLGDASKAEALYGRIVSMSQAMDINNTLGPALKQLGDLKIARGQVREAEDLYRKAIPIWKNHHEAEQEAATLDALAEALKREGKQQEENEAKEKAKAIKNTLKQRLDEM